jgi:hypothetical protein
MYIAPYNAREFVDRIKDLNPNEMIMAAQHEATIANKRSSGVKGAPAARKSGSLEYVEFLKCLIGYLHHQGRYKPHCPSYVDLQTLRPICEILVKKGFFDPISLEVFKS